MQVQGDVHGLADAGQLRQAQVADRVERAGAQVLQHSPSGSRGVPRVDADLEDHVFRDVTIALQLIEQPQQPLVDAEEPAEPKSMARITSAMTERS